MKKSFLILISFVAVASVYSQSILFRNNSPDEVVKLDKNAQMYEFVPGDILIRFKDEVNVKIGKSNGYSAIGVPTIDALFQKYKISSAKKLFEMEQPLKQKQILTDFHGRKFEKPSLHNIYKLKITDDREMFNAIEELKQDPNVIYAEPNYIMSIVEAKPESPVLTEADLLNGKWRMSESTPSEENGQWKINDGELKSDALTFSNQKSQIQNQNSKLSTLNSTLSTLNSTLITTPNDPLYPQQYWIPATQVDAVWDSTTGDTTQIIAILDTGVDWLHPDLKNKIWINLGEIPGNGIDDDGNGKVDDVRGWDWINNDNNPTDDNSHGTHVAGIAAAESNNGIGIAGVNWKAKIMCLKVFQSSGRGDAATITQGINYAVNKAAKVLNMSWGSYARSMTMEAVLQSAYATTILVGAAGNDSRCIGPGIGCAVFYPAGLSYVFGVEASASGGYLAGFSNYDQDGPVFSLYDELFCYELRAPGTAMISCIPNGNYRAYSGTSMAAPVVSAAALLYKKLISDEVWEMMWIKFIYTRGSSLGDVKFFDALTIKPKPLVYQLSRTIVDSCATCDKDGRVDAGETIEMWFKVRNVGGPCDSVFYKIRFGEFEDTTTAQILKSTAYVGSMGPYATRNSTDQFIIKISPNVAHDRDIVFEGLMWYKGATDTTKQRIILNVENGTELSGVMDSTFILTSERLWLVNESYRVGLNGHLIIRPGTKIINNVTIVNRGIITGYGTPDSLIIIRGGKLTGNGSFRFRFTTFVGTAEFGWQVPEQWYGSYSFDFCEFKDIWTFYGLPIFNASNLILSDCVISECWATGLFSSLRYPTLEGFHVQRSNFTRSRLNSPPTFFNWLETISTFKHNNFSGITSSRGGWPASLFFVRGSVGIAESQRHNNYIGFGMANDHESYAFHAWGDADVINIIRQYWGTLDSSRISYKQFYDFWDNPNRPMIRIRPYLTAPSDSAHGIVWKVLVNGKDAQDEIVDPIGVGPQRFDVYFNRPMDTAYSPVLGFGVRQPYNSNLVRDSARWSPDRKVWTAYHNVKLYTGDGINRVRVEGARDPEGFEIPVEDMRFEFLINAAGSASADFQATAGMGKVALEWSFPPDVSDLLGYNIYRFHHLTDTTFTNPIMVNTSLVLDTLFTDFSVTPNKKYYYYYKVVRTNFSESDSSKIVSATPFTAARGDANGDLSVNVLDVISIVSYILGQNPQPFIFAAGDVNNDGVINVLDIVGTVNIILGSGTSAIAEKTTVGNARIELNGDKLELTTSVPIAGIQFKLEGNEASGLQFYPSEVFQNFEFANGTINDTTRVFLAYNLNGTTIPAGRHTLGRFSGITPQIKLREAVLSDQNGNNVLTKIYDNGEPLIPEVYYLHQNFPNPFNSQTKIQFGVPESVKDLKIVIYNILGQRIKTFRFDELKPGRYQIEWNGKNDLGSTIASGVYIYQLQAQKFINAKKMLLVK